MSLANATALWSNGMMENLIYAIPFPKQNTYQARKFENLHRQCEDQHSSTPVLQYSKVFFQEKPIVSEQAQRMWILKSN